MSFQHLTPGAIQKIFHNQINGQHFLVQVLDVKPIGTGNAVKYRLIISDGQHYQQALLASQLNQQYLSGKLKINCIIRLKEIICSQVSGKSVGIVLDMEVVDPGSGVRIGQPSSIADAQKAQQVGGGRQPNQQSLQQSFQQPPHQSYQQRPLPQQRSQPYQQHHHQSQRNNFGSQQFRSSSETYQPIAALNPYQNRWKIKARVTKKSDVRTWNNTRGEGKLFSVDLLDKDGGEIRCTMFNDQCDQFFPIFQEGGVFLISKGTLKIANKRWCSLKNDYEITLERTSEVIPVSEDVGIKKQVFDFCNLKDIEQAAIETNIDVIGIVKTVQPIFTFTSSKTQKEYTKRTLTIIDKDGTTIDLTLWSDEAKKYNEELLAGNPVIAIKSCRISDFSGRSLSASFGSTILLNPDHPKTAVLRKWYDYEGGQNAKIKALSTPGSFSGNTERKTFSAIKDENLGFGDKPDYIMIRGTITFFRHDLEKPPWYTACPNTECNKRVFLDDNRGMWHCEKCNKDYDSCVPRYILNLMVCDDTGSSWLTAFNETAEKLLGKTAKEVKTMKDNNHEEEFEKVFQEANFKTYMMKLRTKVDNWQDETRVRCVILTIEPVDYKQECQYLFEQIHRYEQM